MLSARAAAEIAKSFPEVSVKDHFGGDAYCANKKIFATFWPDKKQVNLMLTPTQQNKFLEIDGEAFSPVPNKWGEKGATTVHLEFVEKEVFRTALKAAWESSNLKPVIKAKAKKHSKVKSKKL